MSMMGADGSWRSELFAHSGLEDDFRTWELLRDHLDAVARTAADFAGVFGAEDFGRALGLLHDIGKASPGFQAYIRGKGASVDHSTAGAALAMRKYHPIVGRMLAFAIAGHHTG